MRIQLLPLLACLSLGVNTGCANAEPAATPTADP